MQRRTERERRPVKKWATMDDIAPPLRPPEMKLRINVVTRDRKQVDHRAAAPSLYSSEEKKKGINNKRVEVEEMAAASPAEKEEARGGIEINKRIKRVERIVPPPLSSEEKRRIKEVAQRVVQDEDGHLTEKLLLRLLSMTRNRARWGFLSPDHPVHPYYIERKEIERCRMLRSQLGAAGGR